MDGDGEDDDDVGGDEDVCAGVPGFFGDGEGEGDGDAAADTAPGEYLDDAGSEFFVFAEEGDGCCGRDISNDE